MTAVRKPYAEQCTRVYTRRGAVAHLLSPTQSIRDGAALCPAGLDWQWDGWRGTGSQNEIDRAASLPTCKHCERSAKAEDDYYAESSQWSKPVAARRTALCGGYDASAAPAWNAPSLTSTRRSRRHAPMPPPAGRTRSRGGSPTSSALTGTPSVPA